MDEQSILTALDLGEERDWEFKSAKGGIPLSLWETYSAMANTDGGCIVLGVDQKGEGEYVVSGLTDPAKAKQDFWNLVNNRNKVNLNLLSDQDVSVVQVTGLPALVIHVPRATRRQRPVYVGQNPLDGTFRRNFEGDYKCRPDEVGRMLADQAEESLDSRVLEHFRLEDLDLPSVQQYRQRFGSRAPDHPWLTLEQKPFLEKLGAWRQDRQANADGVTVAGLLMFGKDEAIRDPLAVPEFHLDYRERLSDDPSIRWTDRLTYDGTWVCNLFQFYQRVVLRLTADIKIPFQLQPELFRKDDTVVHEAIREALVNALIHADYRGQGGVVIEKYKDRLEFSNPGLLLVDFEQLLRGGISECRNRLLQQMFSLVGYGERAGSGIDKIRRGWASQNWRSPSIRETSRPDRVLLVLPMISFLPEESLQRLRSMFGNRLDSLSASEIQALVTAEIEGRVSNARMQEVSTDHPSDLTRSLRRLVAEGFLEQVGQRRWCFYRLRAGADTAGQTSNGVSSRRYEVTSGRNEVSLPFNEVSPPIKGATEQTPNLDSLLAIAEPARSKGKLSPEQMESLILELCKGRFLTAAELSALLTRDPKTIRRYLTSLIKRGALRMRHPEDPNHPDQAYTAVMTT